MCKWLNRIFWKIVVVVFIAMSLFFAKAVLGNAFATKDQIFYESVEKAQASKDYFEVTEKEVTKTVCRTTTVLQPETKTVKNPNSKTEQNNKRVFLYHLLCIIFIIALGVTITTLLIILMKDDTGLRYEKLDELHSIKDKLLGCDDKKYGTDTSTEIKELEKRTLDDKSSEKTSYKSEKNNRADLLKKYMDCVVEI
ncbi:MAG: hypothetical protein IKS40_09075 [Treponema sp.]|nr:hypothetical protein [Treponema sp.]